VRHRHGAVGIFFRNVRGLLNESKDPLSCLVDWVSSILWRLLRCQYKQFGGYALIHLNPQHTVSRLLSS